jgi:hypothetical protein
MYATAFCSFGSPIVQPKRQLTPVYCGAVTAESLQLPLRCESLVLCLASIRLIALPNDRLLALASTVFAGAHGSCYLWK